MDGLAYATYLINKVLGVNFVLNDLKQFKVQRVSPKVDGRLVSISILAEVASHLGAAAEAQVISSVALVLPEAFATGSAAGVGLVHDQRSLRFVSN